MQYKILAQNMVNMKKVISFRQTHYLRILLSNHKAKEKVRKNSKPNLKQIKTK